MMITPRKRGRPPIDPTDHTIDMHVRIPSRQYDILWKRASLARRSVPEQVRHTLATAERLRNQK